MLYIALQHEMGLQKLPATLASRGIQQWLYLGEDSTWRIQAEAILADQVTRISIADRLDEASWRLREQFLDWISSMSRANDSWEWWSSEFAAKNPYTFLFERICLLSVAQDLISAGFARPTLVVCTSPALMEEVLSFASSKGVPVSHLSWHRTSRTAYDLMTAGRSLLVRALLRLPPLSVGGRFSEQYAKLLEIHPAYKRQILAEHGYCPVNEFAGEDTVLLFTWVDRRNLLGEGTYKDPLFGPLPQKLREMGYRVAYVPRVLYTFPFAEAVDRLLNTDEVFFFPEWYLTKPDWVRCQEVATRYLPHIPEGSSIGGVSVDRLAREHVEQTRRALADTLLYEPMIANFASSGIRPRQIIHSSEGHSWEHALAWSVHRRMTGTGVVGYDNVTFSRMVLSMHHARGEYAIRPTPDRLVTNGPLFRNLLIREGMPPEKVAPGCALRHTYLWENSVADEGKGLEEYDLRPIRILVATAIGLGDSVELVAKAARAFGGDEEYEVLVKCHPLVNITAVQKYLGSLALYPNLHFVDEPIGKLLLSSHILLYTYTSVCYEAMMQGVAPVCVRAENFLNLDKLDSTPEIRWLATTPDDLRTVVTEILGMTMEERKAWYGRASQVVREALAPVTPRCFDQFILEHEED